ncbi:hypothetical protein QTH89_14620 [Variovorax sp. J22G21]|nr:hypothetical protein [Variovorax sp. J22G21]MDM0062432.1 hypothetical protein [Variovorax sp. J22G21]
MPSTENGLRPSNGAPISLRPRPDTARKRAAAFRLRVDRAEDGTYHWVISKVVGLKSEVYLATSCEAYRSSREALLQGAGVLEEGMNSSKSFKAEDEGSTRP